MEKIFNENTANGTTTLTEVAPILSEISERI